MKYLGIKELLNHDLLFLFDNKKLNDLNIEIIDNTDEEIFYAVLEMEKKLNGKLINSKNNEKNQNLFWEIIKKDKKYKIYHNFKYPDSSISSYFLENNSEWFFN